MDPPRGGRSDRLDEQGKHYLERVGAASQRMDLLTRGQLLLPHCFVHVRKPDADISRLALDIAQALAGRLVSIETSPVFVQLAEGLEIRWILRRDDWPTCATLASFGLQNDEGVIHETS